jgi:hypothetical protein
MESVAEANYLVKKGGCFTRFFFVREMGLFAKIYGLQPCCSIYHPCGFVCCQLMDFASQRRASRVRLAPPTACLQYTLPIVNSFHAAGT